MHRIFYPILVLVTLGALAALVVPRDGSLSQQSVLGGRAASAQSTGDGAPWSQPYVDQAFSPRGPAEPVIATRPDTWPGGPGASAPSVPARPTQPASEGPRAHLLPPWEGPPPANVVNPPPAQAGNAAMDRRYGVNATAMRPTTMSPPPQPPSTAGPYDAALEGAKPLARVGNEVILASEISLADLNEWIAANKEKVPRDQIEELRRDVLRQRLSPAIDAKLLVVNARRKVPEANMPKVMDHLSESFETQELKKLERRAGVDNRADLDAKLRQQGTSLERVKRAWLEQQLAGGWLYQQVKADKKEITHEQMLKYYYDHLADYDVSAKARWEQLMVRFDKNSGRDAARAQARADGQRCLARSQFCRSGQGAFRRPHGRRWRAIRLDLARQPDLEGARRSHFRPAPRAVEQDCGGRARHVHRARDRAQRRGPKDLR